MARPTYNHEYYFLADWVEALPTRVVVRQQIEAGHVLRVCIGFQALRDERWAEIVRYDDAHGFFHRHAPGVPPRTEYREPITVSVGSRVYYSLEDLRANATRYLREAMAAGFEIPEGVDDDEGLEDA